MNFFKLLKMFLIIPSESIHVFLEIFVELKFGSAKNTFLHDNTLANKREEKRRSLSGIFTPTPSIKASNYS